MTDMKYTLRNKHRAVLDFLYDAETHRVVKILELHDVAYAPPAIIDRKGYPTRKALDEWWHDRAIPASRAQIKSLMTELGISSTLTLAEKNFGLSLSDRYWIDDLENPQDWDKINFFDNDFPEDLGLLTLGQDSFNRNPNFRSPNSTLGGDLNKKWTIVDGTRVLVKGGSGFTNQEVYNEVIATRLHRRLLDPSEFVAYEFYQEGRHTYCACPNMLHDDEELIPAFDLIVNQKKPNSQNDYQFLVSCFEELGLKDVEEYFSKMLTCDFILGNFDRHYRNFGVIRNVETLEYTRFAPIFDSGNSLWCQAETLDAPIDFEYIAKPFGRMGMTPQRQLGMLSHFEWFDPAKLNGFVDEVTDILASNPNMPQGRIEKVTRAVEHQIEHVIRFVNGQPGSTPSRELSRKPNQPSLVEQRNECTKASRDLEAKGSADPSIKKVETR